MGFPQSDTEIAASQTASNMIKLYKNMYYEILIDSIGENIETSSGRYCSFIIPIYQDSGDFVIYTDDSVFSQKKAINRTTIRNLHIRLKNNNTNVNLRGLNWQMLIEFGN
jgi:hypothetical protein